MDVKSVVALGQNVSISGDNPGLTSISLLPVGARGQCQKTAGRHVAAFIESFLNVKSFRGSHVWT